MMDIEKSLLNSIYTHLTTDATLKSRMGGSVRLYLTWAPAEASFPYLVHRLDLSRIADWSPKYRIAYLLDIWSYSTNADEIFDIREQIMNLLDNYSGTTSDGIFYWMWKQTAGLVPETAEGIWHYNCQLNLRYVEESEIGVLLRR
jgi:hypothetical protein